MPDSRFRRPFLPPACGALLLGLLLTACGPGTPEGPLPQAYDPPGAVVTMDKPITRPHRRTIGMRSAGVYASNEFAGGRLDDFFRTSDSLYTAVIRPENAPINNSPWYAFQLWADRPQTIYVEMTYVDGTHRYVPKLSRDGHRWRPIDPAAYRPDTSAGTARLRLDVGPDTLWVSAQELLTSDDVDAWTARLAERPWVTRDVIGTSRQGRPLYRLTITEAWPATDFVLVIGRQHPPEVTGSLAVQTFLETLADDTDLARRFRRRFAVLAVPLVNPDGVDEGHWRHNTGGVDLNRDWLDFNQPETRQVRDAFLPLREDPDATVYFAVDFHSTQYDVFYTLDRSLEAFPDGLVDRWLETIAARLPTYTVRDEPFGLGSPVSKNWFYETFGATAVTYEVGDENDRDRIRSVARTAAEALMERLLEVPDAS